MEGARRGEESAPPKAGFCKYCTARYRFDMLVHFEVFSNPSEAIEREREIKGWQREKKPRLILAANPDWADLSAEWVEDESWKAIPEAKFRPVLRRQPRKS